MSPYLDGHLRTLKEYEADQKRLRLEVSTPPLTLKEYKEGFIDLLVEKVEALEGENKRLKQEKTYLRVSWRKAVDSLSVIYEENMRLRVSLQTAKRPTNRWPRFSEEKEK